MNGNNPKCMRIYNLLRPRTSFKYSILKRIQKRVTALLSFHVRTSQIAGHRVQRQNFFKNLFGYLLFQLM